ncbi:MAG: hypothetical protein J6X01_03560 [Bacteroidales bacterium]|nr:hypothetical protein [Bacteroidales bacterium]
MVETFQETSLHHQYDGKDTYKFRNKRNKIHKYHHCNHAMWREKMKHDFTAFIFSVFLQANNLVDLETFQEHIRRRFRKRLYIV